MSPSASDVITYVGVPLAVLGVLPILYNAVVTFLHWYQISSQLRSSNITAKVRVDAFNRIVDVQFNRYMIRPPPYDTGHLLREDVWTPTPTSSTIRGGSWRRLPWELRLIGTDSQRTHPGDNLRQPPAKIHLFDLLTYLYDLGATPVLEGWPQLIDRGLWTQRGCVLMTIGSEPALQVARAGDDSGDALVLELGRAITWTSIQQRRPAPGAAAETAILRCDSNSHDLLGSEDKEMASVIQTHGEDGTFISCFFAAHGIIKAVHGQYLKPRPDSVFRQIQIGHLKVDKAGNGQGMWFSACCAAMYATSDSAILSFRPPDQILDVASTPSVPRGVLEALSIVESQGFTVDLTSNRVSQTNGHPEKSTKDAIRDEAYAAVRREAAERSSRMDRALGSPLLNNTQIAASSLEWLERNQLISVDLSTRGAVELILSRMVVLPEFNKDLCQMLNIWKDWTLRGRMTTEDVEFVEQSPILFAQASLVMATLQALVDGPEKVLLGIQECLDRWETVLLA